MNRAIPILALALFVAGIIGFGATIFFSQTQTLLSPSEGYSSPYGGMMGQRMMSGVMGGGMMGRRMMGSVTGSGMMGGMMRGRSGNFGNDPYTSPSPAPAGKPIDREIKITARNFQFDPARVTVKQGETVRFVIANQDPIPHDLVSRAGRISYTLLPPNATQSVVWIASARGTYPALCTFHPGMQLQILVE